MAERIWDQLVDDLTYGRVVILAGAGVSSAATRGRIPEATWGGLLRSGANRASQVGTLTSDKTRILNEHLRLGELGDIDEFLFAAEMVTTALGGGTGSAYQQWLAETVGSMRPVDTAVPKLLASLKSPIATTNYDDIIERSTDRRHTTWEHPDQMQLVFRGQDDAVAHLHGHWSEPRGVVLGFRAYDELLRTSQPQNLQQAISAVKSFLLVGASGGLRDPNFLALWGWLENAVAGSACPHYLLCCEAEKAQLEPLKEICQSLELQPYGQNYDDLPAFLGRLVAEVRRQDVGHDPEDSPLLVSRTINWYGDSLLPDTNFRIWKFQSFPVSRSSSLADYLTPKCLDLLRSIYTDHSRDGWTYLEHSRFNRLYATSSVLYALAQLEVPLNNHIIAQSVEFLSTADMASVDDRAGSFFLATMGMSGDQETLAMVKMLAERQVKTPGAPHRGAFLLKQGPEEEFETSGWWSGRRHSGGASFHACHVSDVLLHLRTEHQRSRAAAERVLWLTADYLDRSFASQQGWLTDLEGRRSHVTLYGYSVCDALGVPLPIAWRDVTTEIMTQLTTEPAPVSDRSLGVMNVSLLLRRTGHRSFRREMLSSVVSILEALRSTDSSESSCVEASLVLRACLYGLALYDEEEGAHFKRVLSDQFRHISGEM